MDNLKGKESSDNFMERMTEYIDKKFDKKIASNRDDNQVINMNLNGYRSLGTFQMLQTQSSVASSYVVGGIGSPTVSE